MLLTGGPLNSWWQQQVRSARREWGGGSTQGYYVFGADGNAVLGDNFIPRIPSLLDRGHQLWRQNPARPVGVSEQNIRNAQTAVAPPGTSIIRLFNRIRPVPPGASEMNAMLGRDYLWITADEVRELLSAGAGGQSFAMPRGVVARLAVFHLVDNIRGQVWPWQPQSVSRANFTARLVRANGGARMFSFSGDYAKRDSRPPQWNDRGQEGRVEGEFEVDVTTAKITRFRAIADSLAWSDATYDRNGAPPSGRYPLLTAMVEANDELAQRVAPEPAAQGGSFYLNVRLAR